MFKIYKLILISLLVSFSYAKVTPSDVFVEAKAVKLALAQESIREKGVSLLPVIDIDLKGATPSSVYALASSLNMKLMIYAKSKNKTWKAAKFPSKKITPHEVRELIFVIEENISSIFGKNDLKREKAENKKPADVARELTFANQWLDQIMPFVKPQYPMAIFEKTTQYLDKVIKKKGIPLIHVNPKIRTGIKPKDVFLNTTATYNLLRNFKRTFANETSAVHPYNILSATDKIKPLDVYSLAVFNLFYLYTISKNFGVNGIDTTDILNLKDNIKPNNVYRQVDIVNFKLASIIALEKGDENE